MLRILCLIVLCEIVFVLSSKPTSLKQMNHVIQSLMINQRGNQERIQILEKDVDKILSILQAKTFEKQKNEEKIRTIEKISSVQNKRIQSLEEKCTGPEKTGEEFDMTPKSHLLRNENGNDNTNTEWRRPWNSYPKNKTSIQNIIRGRGITGTIAFYSYMGSSSSSNQQQTFVFDIVKTNAGSAYNANTGMFTAPISGFYVFSWTIFSNHYGRVYSELVVNANPYAIISSDSEEVGDVHAATGIVVAQLTGGDRIYVRTAPSFPMTKNVVSDIYHRSSFSGWRIF